MILAAVGANVPAAGSSLGRASTSKRPVRRHERPVPLPPPRVFPDCEPPRWMRGPGCRGTWARQRSRMRLVRRFGHAYRLPNRSTKERRSLAPLNWRPPRAGLAHELSGSGPDAVLARIMVTSGGAGSDGGSGAGSGGGSGAGSSEQVLWYLLDHLGSVRGIVNSGG
jgi:hypothetical protein